ncbi:MAG: toprim domain-containing protein [Anaerolineaceae bacterium]|nr:toprim domain-containing protein [Anaerolineaceae bacterium]
MRRESCTFKEALKILGVTSRPGSHPYLKSEIVDINRLDWTDQAEQFIEESINTLWSCEGSKALAWLYARGLNDESLKSWKIGYNPCDKWGIPAEWGLSSEDRCWLPRGITIPCRDQHGLHYVNIRRPAGDPKYFKIKGSIGWLFGAETMLHAYSAFLFESEFDVILASQTGLGVGFISLPASSTIPADWADLFGEVDMVIVAYDNDEPGRKAADKFVSLPGFHLAEPFPMGKDPTEFVQAGGDLFEWVYGQLGLLDSGRAKS